MKHLLPVICAALLLGCGSQSPMGKQVNSPFTGHKYRSNNRFFRAVGEGSSSNATVAVNKAGLTAKQRLASQVNTTLKNVADQYLGQTSNASAGEVAEKFQSLTREAMNTEISDLRRIGQKKYIKDDRYTAYVAYEIKKKAMFKFMKKRAEASTRLDGNTKNSMKTLIENLMEDLEEE